MSFDITILTDVSVGGNPDVGEQPTAGLLSDLIDNITELSDELASNSDIIDIINNQDGRFYLGNEIESDIRIMIKAIKSRIMTLQQLTYGDYHDYVRPLPTEYDNKFNYGIEYPY